MKFKVGDLVRAKRGNVVYWGEVVVVMPPPVSELLVKLDLDTVFYENIPANGIMGFPFEYVELVGQDEE